MILRSFEDKDFSRVSQLKSYSAEYYLHEYDKPYRLALAKTLDRNNTQLCEDDEGNILGWCMLGSWQFLDLFVNPAASTKEVEERLIKYALAQWGKGAGSRGRHLWTGVHEENQYRQNVLMRNGFELDSWHLTHMERTTELVKIEPKLPSRFQIRQVNGLDELEKIVLLHQQAFKSEFMNEFFRSEIMGMPEYQQALDLVVTAPNGELAAYGLFWINEEHGQLEPLAVSPKYQGLGLAKAVILDGIKRMKEIGVKTVHVECESYNEISSSCYSKVGFKPMYKSLQYISRFHCK